VLVIRAVSRPRSRPFQTNGFRSFIIRRPYFRPYTAISSATFLVRALIDYKSSDRYYTPANVCTNGFGQFLSWLPFSGVYVDRI